MSTNSKIIILSIILLLVLPLSAQEKVSPQKAFLKSAILPGWGELSLGNNSGYAFLTTEILLWAANFYFGEEEDLKYKEAFNYAIKYAHIGASNSGNDTYLYHLTKYTSSGFDAGGYNAAILEQAESIEDPLEREEFIQNNIYPDNLYWEWDSKDRMRRYKIMRKDAGIYSDYAKSIGGVIIANHIISAINALRVGAKKNRTSFQVTFDREMNPQFLCTYKF